MQRMAADGVTDHGSPLLAFVASQDFQIGMQHHGPESIGDKNEIESGLRQQTQVTENKQRENKARC